MKKNTVFTLIKEKNTNKKEIYNTDICWLGIFFRPTLGLSFKTSMVNDMNQHLLWRLAGNVRYRIIQIDV